MPSLIAKAPLAGAVPLTIGGVTLSEADFAPVTSVAPFAGRDEAVAAALAPLGLAFPGPNRMLAGPRHRIVWTGRGQAFLIGDPPEGLESHAAVTDQSDGWATLLLEGPGAGAVLARLVPIDLRVAAFPAGAAARTGLNHMALVIWRSGPEQFTLMVFRSMARTAWHEIETAMKALAARAAVE